MQGNRDEAIRLPESAGFTRTLAIAIVTFLVITVPVLDDVMARLFAAAAVCGCTLIIGYARRSTFLRTARPYPAMVIAIAWVAFAIGWGFVLPSLTPLAVLPLVFVAVLLAGVAWLWCAARFVKRITLQPLIELLLSHGTFLYFAWSVLQLGNTGGAA